MKKVKKTHTHLFGFSEKGIKKTVKNDSVINETYQPYWSKSLQGGLWSLSYTDTPKEW